MKLILHLVDGSFSPKHSSYTGTTPLHTQPPKHVVNLPVGRGEQTIKWLTLAAQQRLKQLHVHNGRVRQREPVLGSSASYIPQGLKRGTNSRAPSSSNTENNTNTNDDPSPQIELDPYAQINECFQDGDIIVMMFNQTMGCSISDWTSSAFYRHRFVEDDNESGKIETKEGEPATPTPTPKIRDPSMFFERIFESDSGSIVETRPLMDRAFESDWKFHVKKPRFMKRQPKTIRERMRKYFPMLKAVYTYYAACSNEGSPFTLNMMEMRTLMSKCDLPFDHLEVLWAETNYEQVKDEANNDRELQRFEFVEIFIRLAFEHFVKKEHKKYLGDKKDSNNKSMVDYLDVGLVELLEEHVFPQAWRGIPHARYLSDPDAFRVERLYNEDINKVLLSRCDELYSLFCAYACVTQQREGNVVGSQHSPTLVGYHEYLDMCKTSKLIGVKQTTSSNATTKSKKKKKAEESKEDDWESLKTCRVAFALCQMTVVDELSRSKRKSAIDNQEHATFVEFLEAIVRLTDMKTDPKGADPKYQLSTALKEVLTQIVDEHDNINFWSKSGTGNDGTGNPKRLWREYKKKFGQSRNAVKRRGHGPEVGVRETKNANKQVLLRRAMSITGVFAMTPTTITVLSRKYTGGINTELKRQQAERELQEEQEKGEEGKDGGKK